MNKGEANLRDSYGNIKGHPQDNVRVTVSENKCIGVAMVLVVLRKLLRHVMSFVDLLSHIAHKKDLVNLGRMLGFVMRNSSLRSQSYDKLLFVGIWCIAAIWNTYANSMHESYVMGGCRNA